MKQNDLQPKLVYIAMFDDGASYVGFCDEQCKRLRPYFEGRVGFHGRLHTKFKEQKRCWGYDAPVYNHALEHHVMNVSVYEVVDNRAKARELKKVVANTLRLQGIKVLNAYTK